MESIQYKVKQLVVPQMSERILNGMQVKKFDLGDWIDSDCTAAELRQKSIQVIENDLIPANLQKYSDVINQQGSEKAAHHIVKYIAASKT